MKRSYSLLRTVGKGKEELSRAAVRLTNPELVMMV